VLYGYLTGILIGVVCACLLFAISYARVGIVRRHLTRAQFASNVDRSQEVSKYLRKAADAIQIYWLSGYIFFGSFLTFRLAVPSAVAELEHCLAAKQMLSWQFGKCLVHSKRVRSGFLSAQASDRAPMTTLSPPAAQTAAETGC
jgi:MFS superfamily sulfate permease-like transporter